ncbi:MAG: EAL domain-containing protein, partial [Eubacteriales bacterium]|nr:EAL domain-containing protein [Eubacteriales bacterium]
RFALHSAKLKGKNKFLMFSREEYEKYVRKIDIQEGLRVSINNGFEGFLLYYQPIYGLDKETVLGAEALIRWDSKKYGFMSPNDFIPLLEESALIIPLGRWIIRKAAQQCEKWCRFFPDFVMHINLSFVQVIKSNIVKDILSGIKFSGLEHNHFVFEVTESGEMDSSNVVHNVLQDIHNNNFVLAIDDFGTGYSNMRYIKDMMFGIIKIDRAFITNINENTKNYILVKSIIEMIHGLGLRVCVEGVETADELTTVQTLKPDTIQGFYYGKPMQEKEFEKKFLRTR